MDAWLFSLLGFLLTTFENHSRKDQMYPVVSTVFNQLIDDHLKVMAETMKQSFGSVPNSDCLILFSKLWEDHLTVTEYVGLFFFVHRVFFHLIITDDMNMRAQVVDHFVSDF